MEDTRVEENIKRITFKVSSSFHKAIKQKALDRNITITRYIMRALWVQLKKEKAYEEKEGTSAEEANCTGKNTEDKHRE